MVAHQRQYVVASKSSEHDAHTVVPHSAHEARRSWSMLIPQ
ncbi:MAG TPA: hypothetical protein VGR82_10515 [Methylomirabilota bacterium]|nr:hypothetical protein [Methylomirabilota bacterium]